MAIVRFDIPSYIARVNSVALRNVGRAAAFCAGQARIAVNRGQPTRTSRTGRIYGTDPSRPGEPPKVVTGRLKQSIFSTSRLEGNSAIGEFGARTKYAARLEFGFLGVDSRGRRIAQAARPFLRPILQTYRQRILSIVRTGS